MSSHIYSVIDMNKLEDILTSLHHCTNLPVRLIDNKGTTIFHFGQETKFCTLFSQIKTLDHNCKTIQERATQMAIKFGDTYFFSCSANLNTMVYPLLSKDILFGSVFIGPFLMDDSDPLLLPNLTATQNIKPEQLILLYHTTSEIKYIEPSLATHISRLLYYSLNSLQSENFEQININKQKLHQQSKINEAIQLYKTGTMPLTSNYPIKKENELIIKTKTGDTEAAKNLLNELLGYVFFFEGNNLESVKIRSIELCSLLSRAAIEGGAPSTNILSVNQSYLHSLQSINSLETLCYKLQKIIDVFIESMYYKFTDTNNIFIKKAIKYITSNFANNITLEIISDFVNLSPAYFSTLFKKVTGINYIEYLNYVRIEESKRLLANTNYSILNIAIATGFEDQSYFSKVFKKQTGFSPGKYRK